MDIVLKTRTAEHVAIFWNETQDEEIRKAFPMSDNSLEQALQLFHESQQDHSTSYGKVIYFEDKYIGDIWIYAIDEKDEKMAMLSILIFKKQVWGSGLGTKAMRIFIQDVFDKYSLEKIGSFTYASNHPSIKLLQKSGFVEKDTFFEDGIESKYFEISYGYHI